jgi:hypothetical protein
MSEDQFTKLFKYMQGEFKLINQKLDDKASAGDMQMVLNSLDSIVKRQEISDDERLVMGHQLDRLDRWTHELASKIGYTLTV